MKTLGDFVNAPWPQHRPLPRRRGVQHHHAPGAICSQVLLRCLLLCALTSCAPANRDAWKTTLSLRSPGLCWWRDARWEDRGPLLVRGTGQPFARARAQWSGQLWRGSSISAVLRRAGPVVLLQGEWAGPGLTLDADVDVSSNSVFRAYEPVRVGPAGLLLKGGHVRVADADLGRALVLPAEESLDSFHPFQQVALELPCESLSLSAQVELPGDLARRQLAQSGFPATAQERWVPQGVIVSASAQAGGPTVGQFISHRLPVRGFVVEQQKDEARLVVPTCNGVVWVGWVAAEGLQAHVAAAPVAEEKKVKSEVVPPALEWKACETSLPVSIESHGKIIDVGALEAKTAFAITERNDERVEVELSVEWLELEPGVRLMLPAYASKCPRQKQLGAW